MKKFTTELKCPVLCGFTIKGECRIIFCGQWSCPHCSKILARKWAIRVKMHIKADKEHTQDEWFLLTLTLGSSHKSVIFAYKALRKLWNRLRMAISRENKNGWQYVAFVEGQPHRDNMPHFHVIMNVMPRGVIGARGKPTKHAAHNFAHRMGWGFQADFKAVSDNGAANYVAKYVSKGSGVVPRGFRRVRTSRGWTKLPKDPARMLIVMRKDERIQDYLIRVADITAVEIDELYTRWQDGQDKLEDLQSVD